jgi:hypothetical protein
MPKASARLIRPCLEALEDRLVPSSTDTGTSTYQLHVGQPVQVQIGFPAATLQSLDETIGFSGTAPPGMGYDNSTGNLEGTPTRSGTYTVVSQLVASGIVSVTHTFVMQVAGVQPPPPPPVQNFPTYPSQLPDATLGQPYQAQGPGATNGYTFSARGLPAGLTMDPATGNLSGTPQPSQPGTFPLSVTVTGPDSSRLQQSSVTVNARPTIDFPGVQKNGEVGVSYDLLMTATGGTKPLTWTVSSGILPPGLQMGMNALDPNRTAEISGTPTTPGDYTFALTVTDKWGAADTENVEIRIAGNVTTNMTFVNGAIQVLFHHGFDSSNPFDAGLLNALNTGAYRPIDVAALLELSPEGQMVNTNDLFQNLLGRTPAAGELGFYQAFLAQGVSMQQLEGIVMSSDEFYNNIAGGTDAGWINAVYSKTLGHQADASAQAFWGGQLSGLEQFYGYTPQGARQVVATEIALSPEAAVYQAGIVFVRLFNRQADFNSLVSISSELVGAAPVNGGFVTTPVVPEQTVLAMLVADPRFLAGS